MNCSRNQAWSSAYTPFRARLKGMCFLALIKNLTQSCPLKDCMTPLFPKTELFDENLNHNKA